MINIALSSTPRNGIRRPPGRRITLVWLLLNVLCRGKSGEGRIIGRITLVWLLLSMLLSAACSAPQTAVLRFALASAPINLDPRFTTDATSARINRLLYRQLVDFDGALRPVAGLAEWERLTPTHYRFRLRADRAVFHDGTVLTAADVKATYDSVLDPATASPHRAALSMVERVEVVDETTVDFHLHAPDSLFVGRLVIGILPAAGLAAHRPFARQPLGSGPFLFEGWPEEGKLLLQRRRDGQRLEFVTVKDPTVRLLKLLRSEVDMMQNDLPPELIEYARGKDSLQVLTAEGSNFSYLGFNLQDALTSDLALRRAIAYAIDRRAIITHMLGNAARPASALLPPDHWAGDSSLGGYDYDPAKARVLLQQAGYDAGRRPRLVYKTSSDPFRLRLATVIAQQLGEVGIDVELQAFDWGTFYGDIKAGRFQMFSLSWVGVKTPDIFHYAFHSESVPPAGANRGRYVDPETDALIDAADKSEEGAQQVAAYRAVQARLLETLPYVPLWYEDHVFVARRDLSGYQIALDGNIDGLEWVTRGSAHAAAAEM